jgi:hypothetical protein
MIINLFSLETLSKSLIHITITPVANIIIEASQELPTWLNITLQVYFLLIVSVIIHVKTQTLDDAPEDPLSIFFI